MCDNIQFDNVCVTTLLKGRVRVIKVTNLSVNKGFQYISTMYESEMLIGLLHMQ